jgi:hypothetical protein
MAGPRELRLQFIVHQPRSENLGENVLKTLEKYCGTANPAGGWGLPCR